MSIASRFFFSLLTVSIGMVDVSGIATAQEFPTRQITIVVPNGPGAASDLVPRSMTVEMSKFLGQPVIIENKPGANNLIGFDYVARQAPADGYTMLQVSDTSFSILPLMTPDIQISPLRDLPPVIGVAQGRQVLASSSQEPWTTFKEMVAYAKANPGKLNYAGSSASTHLQSEAMMKERGINVVYVPYNTVGAGMTAILSREVSMGLINEGLAPAMGDRLRVLAVTGETRSHIFPDVPTFTELGLPQIKGFTISLNVRAGTPKSALDKLYAAGAYALKQPQVVAQIAKLELEVVDQPAAVVAKNLAEQSKLFAETAKQIGLKPE